MKRTVSGIMLTLLLVSMLSLAFNIQPTEASGTIYIMPDGSIWPPTAPISSDDNVTYTFTDNISEEITVQRSNIIIDGCGLTLQGYGTGDGFWLHSFSSISVVDNVTIKNAIIKNFEYGISIKNSTLNTISGNTITENQKHGVHVYQGANYTTVSGNTIIQNSRCGVDIYESYSNNVCGNEIQENSWRGVDITDSHSNTISGNNIINNGGTGIQIHMSSYDIVSGNTITANDDLGITLADCDHCTVSDNVVTSCQKGIYVLRSTDNSISGNTLTASTWQGILLSGSSDRNVICANTIEDSSDVGIGLDGSFNTVYHNHILNNMRQAYDLGTNNVWDDGWPSGGNYWTDYYGTDYYLGPLQDGTGSDGIGDTPHLFRDNQDRYPLLLPENKIVTESNTTITNVVATRSALYFETSGPDETIGYINATLPVAVNKTAIKVFVDNIEITPPPFPIITTNGTHYFVYFEFDQSVHGVTIRYAIANIAVADIKPSKKVVGQGLSLNINLTIANQGDNIEILSLTAYANTTIIALLENITVENGTLTTVTFTWNATSFAKGNYTIEAIANEVPGETNTTDNRFTDGFIIVAMIGDITGPDGWPDGKCDMRDIGMVARQFGKTVPPGPADCDLTGLTPGLPDGKIDMRDIGLVARHFGERDP